MKNLNAYGEEFIEKIKEEGKLEDINEFHQISYISVTESNTNHLINMDVSTHSEEIYIYKNRKYSLDTYTEQECNELFTFPKSLSQEKKENLINNFLDNPYENLNDYSIKYINESEYDTSRDVSIAEIRNTLEKKVLN